MFTVGDPLTYGEIIITPFSVIAPVCTDTVFNYIARVNANTVLPLFITFNSESMKLSWSAATN